MKKVINVLIFRASAPLQLNEKVINILISVGRTKYKHSFAFERMEKLINVLISRARTQYKCSLAFVTSCAGFQTHTAVLHKI